MQYRQKDRKGLEVERNQQNSWTLWPVGVSMGVVVLYVFNI